MNNGSLGITNGDMKNQPFFTPGPGEEIDKNDKDPIDNINLSNKAATWANADGNRRAGGMAMNIAGREKEPTKQEIMGEVTLVNPDQPNTLRSEILSPNNNQIDRIIDFNNFSAKGDKISKETLNKITHVVDEYKAGKISPAALDDAEWEGTKAYVKGSFGRDLAT